MIRLISATKGTHTQRFTPVQAQAWNHTRLEKASRFLTIKKNKNLTFTFKFRTCSFFFTGNT